MRPAHASLLAPYLRAPCTALWPPTSQSQPPASTRRSNACSPQGCAREKTRRRTSFAGAPSVGWLAETIYGYRMPSGRAAATSEASHANADALARALLVCTMVPWSLCFLCYTALHLTYPNDYRRVRGLAKEREARGA